MKTIEEVREHFKDAKVVECLSDNVYITIGDLDGIREYDNTPKTFFVSSLDCKTSVCLYRDSYAKIIEYKTPEIPAPIHNVNFINKCTPERYKTDSIDVIDFCKLYNLNFNMGNIVKYACRSKDDDINDLKKIIDYAQRELEFLINKNK